MGLGLLLTAFGLGIRHGVDWDHIAAIADLSSTSETRRRGFVLSMLYAVGHGAVVFALGAIAIAFGSAIPEGLDRWMGRVVGITLVALGVWILVELVRKGRSFRLRSRWMLIIDGTFTGFRKVRNAATQRTIEVEHDHVHPHDDTAHEQSHAHDHAHERNAVVAEVDIAERVGAGGRVPAQAEHTAHSHGHRHELALPSEAGARYGKGTATGIGMLHGVGIESPTQIAIFVSATSVASIEFSFALLGVWVAGLIVANAGLALAAGAGLLQAERNFGIYATLAVVVSVFSIALGVLFIANIDVLPGILT